MIVAGRANVRAVTWSNSTIVMPAHMPTPDAGSGGKVEEGRTERYGARK
jgi:hypothetical protein